jgi:hypothetical protein
MTTSFSAKVGEWATRVEGALLAVFKESVQELAAQVDMQLVNMVYEQPPSPSGYKRTGFLRASVMASKSAMPALTRENPGAAVPTNLGDVMVVINSAVAGDTIYLGYTANYASYVHYGANGRAPRPWVALVAQRWEQIVNEKAVEVKARLGL